MAKPTDILVPLDVSVTSEDILRHARVLADGFGARVHVMHVITDPDRTSGRSGVGRFRSFTSRLKKRRGPG